MTGPDDDADPSPPGLQLQLRLRLRLPQLSAADPDSWPFRLVLDDPDVRWERWAAGLTDLRSGALAVALWPQAERGGLCADLLYALGRDDLAPGGSRLPTWDETAPWLLGAGVTDLVITHAQWLPVRELDELLRLVTATGARLWLVGDGSWQPETAAAVERWTPLSDALTWHGFATAWQQRPPPLRPVLHEAWQRLPAWPDGLLAPDLDMVLLTAGLDAQPAAVRDPVRERLEAGAAFARTQVLPALTSEVLGRRHKRAGRLSVADILTDRLAWLSLRAASGSDALLLAQGAALELLSVRIHVRIDRPALRAAHAAARGLAGDGAGLSQALLRRHQTPAPAAAALIAVGVPEWQLGQLRYAQITSDGRGVQTSAGDIAVDSDDCALALRAQHFRRWLDGAEGSEPFLPLEGTPAGQERAAALLSYTVGSRSGITYGAHALLGCPPGQPGHRCAAPWTVRPLRADEPALRAELGLTAAAGPTPAWRRAHIADRELPALADSHSSANSLSGDEVAVLLAAALGPLSSSTLGHVASLRAANLSLHGQGLVVRANRAVQLAPHLDTNPLRRLADRCFTG